ncbi:MAG: glycosyltransferase family protein [Magnetococcales bacterium]|nr:glycosyltransferase family protein [Magnetococcales bacterium]
MTNDFVPHPQRFWSEIVALNGQGYYAAALARMDPIFAVGDPGLAGWKLRGQALYGLGRFVEALEAFARVVGLDPHGTEGYEHLATAFLALQQLDRALLTVGRGLEIDPENKGLLRLKFILGWRIGNKDDALTLAAQHLRRFPDDGPMWHERGICYLEAGADAWALADFEVACSLMPEHSIAFGNRGTAFWRLGRYAESLESFNQAIRLDTNNASAQHHRALLLLFLGDWVAGFSAYEWRWRDPAHLACKPSWAHSPWQGEVLPHATLMVYPEQGYGDTIQFIRFLPMARHRVARVVFYCTGPLVPLLRYAPGMDCLWEGALPGPPFDVSVPLMSLPGLLHHSGDDTRETSSYLPALAWKRPAHDPRHPSYRIGFVWRGRPTHKNDHNRSLTLSWFLPFLDWPRVSWVSLQEGGAGAIQEHDLFKDRIEVPELTDFAATARVMATLDLVISVDTAVAHLAGALGCPVWLLLPFVPDWRWGKDGDGTVWYPSMTLFRQEKPGDWLGVGHQVSRALKARLQEGKGFYPTAGPD